MACFFSAKVQDVREKFLTLLVRETHRHGGQFLEPSPSLAFGLLWDTLGHEDDYDPSFPLVGVVAGHDFFGGDYSWTADTADRIISCVGLTDYRVEVVGADGEWSHMTPGGGAAKATFNIAVTDSRWLEHIAANWKDNQWDWDTTVDNITSPPTLSPAWRTPAVLSLAQQIMEMQEFSAMPALGDSLEAAGCDDEYILDHCRGPGPHACGCWALDLILGKRWMTCDDPEAMLRELGDQLNVRKLRLFAVACCRRVEVWAELADEEGRGDDYRNAITVAERFADGAATAAELETAHKQVADNILSRGDRCYDDPFGDLTDSNIGSVAEIAEHIRDKFFDLEPGDDEPLSSPAVGKAIHERVAQAALLRDLYGNVFRPVTFSPEWRTSTVMALAQHIYDSRDFDQLPILADALQDAGCDSSDLLNHCRGSGAHCRGCWALDLVLGKQ